MEEDARVAAGVAGLPPPPAAGGTGMQELMHALSRKYYVHEKEVHAEIDREPISDVQRRQFERRARVAKYFSYGPVCQLAGARFLDHPRNVQPHVGLEEIPFYFYFFLV